MHIDIVGSVTIAKEHWVWAGLLILTTIDAIGARSIIPKVNLICYTQAA